MLRVFAGARECLVLPRRGCRVFSSFTQGADAESASATARDAPSSAGPSLRSANKYDATARGRGKLAQIARPFGQLLHLTAGSATDQLAFRIQESDLQAAGAGEATRRLLSLSMQCQSRLGQHLRQQAMALFCRGPNDTGSPEVQAALWTLKIAALTRHTQAYRHDYVAERKIVEWQDQRRKILRYLKRVSLERYFSCVDRLGLPHDLVEVADPRRPTLPKVRPKSKEGLRKRAHRANQ